MICCIDTAILEMIGQPESRRCPRCDAAASGGGAARALRALHVRACARTWGFLPARFSLFLSGGARAAFPMPDITDRFQDKSGKGYAKHQDNIRSKQYLIFRHPVDHVHEIKDKQHNVIDTH